MAGLPILRNADNCPSQLSKTLGQVPEARIVEVMISTQMTLATQTQETQTLSFSTSLRLEPLDLHLIISAIACLRLANSSQTRENLPSAGRENETLDR
jgi:hypothetical protein